MLEERISRYAHYNKRHTLVHEKTQRGERKNLRHHNKLFIRWLWHWMQEFVQKLYSNFIFIILPIVDIYANTAETIWKHNRKLLILLLTFKKSNQVLSSTWWETEVYIFYALTLTALLVISMSFFNRMPQQ